MSFVYSILAFLIGLLVGWLVWGRRGATASAPVTPTPAPTPEPVTPATPEPVTPATPEPVTPATPEAVSPAATEVTEPVTPAVTEPVAESSPKPHLSAGLAEDPEPVAEPLAAGEPAPVARPHQIGVADEPEPVADPAPVARRGEISAVPVEEPEPAAEPVNAVPAQRVGPIDDLKRLEGIGPKMAAALNAAGINTYADLAVADDATLRSAMAAAKMRRPSTAGTWPRQAQLLADGDVDGFNALARTLKGRS